MKNFRQKALVAGLLSSSLWTTIVQAVPGYHDDFVRIYDTNRTWTHLYLDNGENSQNQDWAISNNYLGLGEFTIIDAQIGSNLNTIPFVIEPSAPDYSLFVDSGGKVGLGTYAPGGPTGAKLTVGTDNFGYASIFLDGTALDYLIGSSSEGFGIVDGSTEDTPFSLAAGAPDASIAVAGSGSVGLGTFFPSATLHVEVNDDAYNLPFIVQNTNAIGFSGFRLQIADDSWIDFNNSGGVFRINADQTPGSEFEVESNGNSTVSGTMTAMSFIQSSDRNEKQDILDINRKDVLEKVIALPITEWSYKADPTSRHIGPMAQDFFAAFQLGNTDKGLSTVDAGGVALAAIQGLKQEKDAQLAERDAQIAQLLQLNAEQEGRLMQLELALAEVLRNQSSAQVGSIN